MPKGRIILEKKRFRLTIERLCYQLIETHDTFDNTCLVGIQPKGVYLADRIHQRLKEILNVDITYGKLDVTFYRDDFRTRETPLKASTTEMDFLVEDKNVILVDDVLYTGRTVLSALTALQHYGRPRLVELVALIDRRFNRHLPIQTDYLGYTVDGLNQAYVQVQWEHLNGEDKVLLINK